MLLLVLIVIYHRIPFERRLLDLSIPYIDMLLGPQKPVRGQAKTMVKEEESQTPEESQTQTIVLPAPEEVLVTLRLQVDSRRPSDVSALIQILLGRTPVRCRNRHLWIQAVQDYFDDVPLCVPCRQLLQFVWRPLLSMGAKCTWLHRRGVTMQGTLKHYVGALFPFLRAGRTDKHSQSIYGPSVTPLESPRRDGTHQVTLVALGGSKAMHEFLILHYVATDSAREWDVFLDSCLPQCTWVRAGSRRALALHMYISQAVRPSFLDCGNEVDA